MFSKGLENPYFDLYSNSTNQNYRFFINIGPDLELPIYGEFDTYGLSNTATVPWF